MQRVRDDRDGRRRYQNHDDRETENRTDLTAEVTKWERDRTRIKERGDEDEEQYIGREGDLRQAGDEREKEPTHY
jgi:hypothetical protein